MDINDKMEKKRKNNEKKVEKKIWLVNNLITEKTVLFCPLKPNPMFYQFRHFY